MNQSDQNQNVNASATHNDNPQTKQHDVNRTTGSGYAGAGGTPEDYRAGSDGDERNEPTGDTNIANADDVAGNAPIAGAASGGANNADRENHPVPGSGGDVQTNAAGAQASSVSGNTTTAGGD